MSHKSGTLPPEGVRSMFDRIAPVYDLMNRVMTVGLDQRWRRLTVRLVVSKGDRVLDACCGTGDLAVAARKAGAEVVGLDFSGAMLERARRKDPSLEWIQGDLLELPFEDASFDCVAANWVLYHVPDLDLGVRELARVIRPGGRLVAATLGAANMQELWDLLAGEVTAGLSFGHDNGEAALAPHFTQIERRQVDGTVVFPDRASMHEFVAATTTRSHLAERVPELVEPFQTRSTHCVFVAVKP